MYQNVPKKLHNPWTTFTSYMFLLPCTVWNWIIVLMSYRIHALTCMWSATSMMMAQPHENHHPDSLQLTNGKDGTKQHF
jgi:hypothetical protein